ncbi:uncharacterized protein LOC111484139 isoform X4 [Cucurbita maxima]|uniref:Uncharacterized protein LOC111484139 isoform X4 n=1 Tax=Cucurbita maxima TaxID=3661 RepID=A0A6J1JDX8_CUCMA|nr:uncharacterized protein LOC111484139 isoform X4 [Cucurbita maxima]
MLLFPFVHFFLVIALCSMHSIHLLCSQRTRLVYQRQRQQRLQRRGNWCQLTAEEGETSKPSTRIATISKSGEWVAQDAQFEKVELQTALPKQRENYKKEIPKEASCSRAKQRTVSLKINCKNTFSSSETHTAQEPQLPPKDGKNETIMMKF